MIYCSEKISSKKELNDFSVNKCLFHPTCGKQPYLKLSQTFDGHGSLPPEDECCLLTYELLPEGFCREAFLYNKLCLFACLFGREELLVPLT
jgi:hypothetical protein